MLTNTHITMVNVGTDESISSNIVVIANQGESVMELDSQSQGVQFRYFGSKEFRLCLGLSQPDNWAGSSYIEVQSNETSMLNITLDHIKSSSADENCQVIQPLSPQNFIYEYTISLHLEASPSLTNGSSLLRMRILENPTPY